MLRNDQPERHILQVLCSDLNTYILYRDGRVFACGANNAWQCSRMESMDDDKDDCVNEFYLRVSVEEQKRIEEQKLAEVTMPQN